MRARAHGRRVLRSTPIPSWIHHRLFGRSLVAAIALVIASLAWTEDTTAMCHVAEPEDAIDCFYEDFGQCCVVQEFHDGDECYVAYCMEFDTCSWQALFSLGCS